MFEIEVLRIIVLITMFVLGAIIGSFSCCQAYRWRNRAQKKKDLGQWSVCMHCKKRIYWFDNIPVISWLVLRGKCRHCHKKIGCAEFLSEVLTGLAFLAIGWAYVWPLMAEWEALSTLHSASLVAQILSLVITMILLAVLVILAVYDAKWGELPTVLLFLSIIFGAMIALLNIYQESLISSEAAVNMIYSTIAGVGILSGTCFLIYKLSNERMMGGGDYLLALAIALALSNWWLCLWVMFLSNLLGDIVALPRILKKGNTTIYYGPFLIVAYVIVLILGNCLPLLLGGVL